MRTWSLITAVNDERVLRSTLLRSPDIDLQCQVIVKRQFPSAALAYNKAIAESSNDFMVFAHSDVYLPQGWLERIFLAQQCLEAVDPRWGILGVVGVTGGGCVAGRIYSTGLRRFVGRRLCSPVCASSLDEMVLVMRRSSGVSFDARLPGFHLYGTDICMAAAAEGLSSYIVPAFCIHNSNGIKHLPAAFWESYAYMRKKWWTKLPLTTCCTRITRSGFPMLREFDARMRSIIPGPSVVGARCFDPEILYQSLKRKVDAEWE